MTVTAAEWVECLRTYKGTKFSHQARTKGVGIDCVGLLAMAADELGINHEAKNITGYDRAPQKPMFEKYLPGLLDPVPYNRLQPLANVLRLGDVLIFWIDHRRLPRHVAVYTGIVDGTYSMIHAYAKQGRGVVETPLTGGYWKPRIHSIWRVPNLKD